MIMVIALRTMDKNDVAVEVEEKYCRGAPAARLSHTKQGIEHRNLCSSHMINSPLYLVVININKQGLLIVKAVSCVFTVDELHISMYMYM